MENAGHEVKPGGDAGSVDSRIPESLVGKRGGEGPSSLLDLIDREMMDLELAGWLVSQVSRGASYIVGAGPGGVGKSTTMRSLLSFVPEHLPFSIALPGEISGVDGVASCVVSHELSDHRVPGYLWGQDLRDFFGLSERGHVRVGNMHVDCLEETRAAVCEENGVSEGHFRALNLLIFIGVEGAEPGVGRIKDPTLRRYVREIAWSDGTSDHVQAYTPEAGLTKHAPRDPDDEARCRAFLEKVKSSGLEDVQQVRDRFLSWDGRPRRG